MKVSDRLKKAVAKVLRRMPAPLSRMPAAWKRRRMYRVLRRRLSEHPRPKVFGIGLSKTGTSSLAYALKTLQYETVNWSEDGRILGWPEFFLADAATDTPCCAQFEVLYHTFERSKFIYTVRDIDDWKQSVRRQFELESPREFREEWVQRDFWKGEGRGNLNFDWGRENALRYIQIHESLYAQHDTWEEAYRAYDKRVRRFFEDKPEHRFATMRITGGDGWEKLCSFLGHEIPEKPFPHVNKSR